MKIYKSQFPSIDLVERSIYTHILPEADPYPLSTPAFIDAESGSIITRADLRRLSLELAWGLRNELVSFGGPKLVRGDTVLVFSPNSLAYPVLVLGSFAAGLKATLANSSYTPPELAHQFVDSEAKLIFVHPSLVNVVVKMFELLKLDQETAKRKIVVADWGLSDKGPTGFLQVDQLLGKGKLKSEEKFEKNEANQTVMLCYSSGTTGKPKGVETTHRNLTTVLDMIKAAIPLAHNKDVSISVLPFFHIYGATGLLQYPVLCGVPVVILPRFEPIAFCKSIEQYKVTIAMIVPPILIVLVRHPAVAQYNLQSLDIIMSGAAPLGAPLVEAVTNRLSSLGCKATIIQGYGLTETSPTSHILLKGDADRKVGSVGLLLPNLEARLVVEGSREAQDGEAGELWLRGPSVMKGYLNNISATKSSITDDGWFKTGDIAIVDDSGFYSIVDRQKELIKYKGFQVPPAELESILLQHPDIADAGVIGIESLAEATELPRAYIVHAKGLTNEQDRKAFCKEVQEWIASRVARHKALRGGVVLINAIPKSPSGKILRRELRELARKELSSKEETMSKAKL